MPPASSLLATPPLATIPGSSAGTPSAEFPPRRGGAGARARPSTLGPGSSAARGRSTDDGQGESREKRRASGGRDGRDGRRGKSRGGAYETFVFVRPPPSSKTNPMNFQCQLVVAPTASRAAAAPRSPGSQAGRASEYSLHSTSSRLSTYSNANSLALSPSSTSLDKASSDGHQEEILNSPGRSRARANDDGDDDDDDDADEQRPLSRSASIRSTASGTSAGSASPSVLSDAASTRSSGSSSGTKRVVPLYNLQFHTVRQTTVADAGTDAKIGVFHKRALELVGLGSLECCEVDGAYNPSYTGPLPQTAASGSSSYFPPAAASSAGTSSAAASAASSPQTKHALLTVPLEPGGSPRISLDTLFSRPSFDDVRAGLGAGPKGGAGKRTVSGTAAGLQSGGKKMAAGFEETLQGGKRLFGNFGKLFGGAGAGGRKKDDAAAAVGMPAGTLVADDRDAGGGFFKSSQSMSSLFSTTSRDASQGARSPARASGAGSGTDSGRPGSSSRRGPASPPVVVLEPSSASASSRPKSAYSTHSIGSTTGVAAAVGSSTVATAAPYLGAPTFGLAPIVRPPVDGAGSSKAGAYVWVISKVATQTDGWSFAAMTETLNLPSASAITHVLSPVSAAATAPSQPVAATGVYFEWVRGRARGAAPSLAATGQTSRKRSGTTATITNVLSGRPGSAGAGGGGLGLRETRTNSSDATGGEVADEPADGIAPAAAPDGEEDEAENPEDSEVPWLCYVVSTAYATSAEGGVVPQVERTLLGKLSPAPYHPKIVAQLRMPFPLTPLALAPPPSPSSGAPVRQPVLTPEQIKDVVCTTAMFLFVREGWGGVQKKGRR